MPSWRQDVAVLRETLADAPSEGWRLDLHAIAKSKGYSPSGWRDSLRLWADEYGILPVGWREDIQGIARALGGDPRSWREALRFIRKYHEENPPTPIEDKFFLSNPPRQQNTRYLVLSSEIIEASKIIMA